MTVSQPSAIANDDRRGVFVPLWVIEACDGDYRDAAMLAQILYWFQPGLDGKPRASFHRNGATWLIRSDEDWERELGMSAKQARTAKRSLVSRGYIATARFKIHGAPRCAIRPVTDSFPSLNGETDSAQTGVDHPPYSAHVGANPVSAQMGADLVIENSSIEISSSRDLSFARIAESPRPCSPAVSVTPKADVDELFDAFWQVYPRKRGKAAARKAFEKAIRHTEPAQIIGAAIAYRDHPGREDAYTKYPQGWLNDGRWDDELTDDRPLTKSARTKMALMQGVRDMESGVSFFDRLEAAGGPRAIEGAIPTRAVGA